MKERKRKRVKDLQRKEDKKERINERMKVLKERRERKRKKERKGKGKKRKGKKKCRLEKGMNPTIFLKLWVNSWAVWVF